MISLLPTTDESILILARIDNSLELSQDTLQLLRFTNTSDALTPVPHQNSAAPTTHRPHVAATFAQNSQTGVNTTWTTPPPYQNGRRFSFRSKLHANASHYPRTRNHAMASQSNPESQNFNEEMPRSSSLSSSSHTLFSPSRHAHPFFSQSRSDSFPNSVAMTSERRQRTKHQRNHRPRQRRRRGSHIATMILSCQESFEEAEEEEEEEKEEMEREEGRAMGGCCCCSASHQQREAPIGDGHRCHGGGGGRGGGVTQKRMPKRKFLHRFLLSQSEDLDDEESVIMGGGAGGGGGGNGSFKGEEKKMRRASTESFSLRGLRRCSMRDSLMQSTTTLMRRNRLNLNRIENHHKLRMQRGVKNEKKASQVRDFYSEKKKKT